MLIFDASKNKKLQMTVESQGISSDKLRFTFTIDTGDVSYGFPCMFNEGRVEVDIPPLSEIIKDLKSGNYQARLDVTGDDKYYLKPFDEQIIIKLAPSIKQVNIQDDDIQESIGVMVSSILEVEEEKLDEVKIDNSKPFKVIIKGGSESILNPNKKAKAPRSKIGHHIVSSFDSKKEAEAEAKALNSKVSAQDKKVYFTKYDVVQEDDKKEERKSKRFFD